MSDRVPGIRRFFRLPSDARTVQAEVDDELRFHLDARTEELQRRGLPPAEARAQALREFGDLTAARSEGAFDERRRQAAVQEAGRERGLGAA